MIRYSITKVSTVAEYQDTMPPEQRSALTRHLPKAAVRRFSESGIQMSAILKDLELQTDEPLVTASSFAESRSLEAFLDSFPTPSPARFQRSVHPGAVQQARVVNAAPLRTYIPIAGKEGIAIIALRSALTLGAPVVCLAGGEECGTWSVAINAGSSTGFAFGMRLERKSGDNAHGSIEWTPKYDADANAPDASLITFYRALHARKPLTMAHPDMGTIKLNWI